MEMVRETDARELVGPKVGGKGPRTARNQAAQDAVDEFLASGATAAEVDWRAMDPDWQMAKRALAYRIRLAKDYALEGAADLGMRSNREERKLFLVHIDGLPRDGDRQ